MSPHLLILLISHFKLLRSFYSCICHNWARSTQGTTQISWASNT